jgi:hypothetical protein
MTPDQHHQFLTGHLMNADLSTGEAMTQKTNKYGCHHCARDYEYEPFTWNVGGIPARTFYFCSLACRSAWLIDGGHVPALLGPGSEKET